MSTAAPRDSQLDGLALSPPRHACTGAPDEALPLPAPATDHVLATETDELPTDAEPARAAQFCEPVPAPLNSGHAPDRQPGAPVRLPRAANLLPPQRETIEWPPALSIRSHPLCDHALPALPRTGLQHEIVPEPVSVERRIDLRLVARISALTAAAGLAAYGLVLISSVLPGRIESARTAASAIAAAAPNATTLQVQPHLLAADRQAFANQPLTLGALVDHTSAGESVVLAGLQAGTRLSTGVPLGPSYWQLPPKGLTDAVVYAPKNFVGVMNTAVDLLSHEGRLIDSEAMQLEWIPKKTADSKPVRPAPLADSEKPLAAAVVSMNPEDAAILMRQGEDLLRNGDIAAARLAFRRVADAGNADAALKLAMTFEPRYLAAHNVIGISGDEAAARIWYQRAKELGSMKANRILAQALSK